MALAGTLAAGAETVTVTAAGTLSGAVTDVTATDLTISGPIDAADLFWAADNMMSLKTLNLSGATIEAYDGDVLKGRMTYPAGAIPEMSFAGSPLTSIVFPTAGNITIGEGAFANTALTSISFPANLTVIGDGAFSACAGLKTLTLPASIKTGSHAFASCTGLTDVTLDATTTAVPDGLFKDCKALKEVKGTESLVTIGEDAFNGCLALNTFTFGSALRRIGPDAFSGSGLTDANLAAANGLKSVGNWAFAHCDALESAQFSDKADVTIGKGVFFDCFSLTHIKLPAQLRTISAYMLKGAESAGGHEELPAQIDSIGAYALKNNGSLMALVLPSTLTYIGDGAMENTTGLTSINATALDQVPMLGENVWSGIDQQEVVLKANENTGEAFKATPQWQDFKIDIETGVDDIIADSPVDGNKAIIRGRFIGNDLVLQAVGSPFSNIRVYDVAGRLVAALDTDESEVALDTSGTDTNIFIVAAVLADNTTGTLKIARR